MSGILIIHTDEGYCELLADCLRPEGFEIARVCDGREGLRLILAGEGAYDLIVLDQMLPRMSGFEVLQRVRSEVDIPIIMLSTRNAEPDRITGLELGADDFLAQPISPRELAARIRAILRRTKNRFHEQAALCAQQRIVVGDIELDAGSQTVRRDGEPIETTSVEFRLLEMLLRASGNVMTRELLSVTVLGRSLSAYDRSLDIHMSRIRKKLGHTYCGIDRIRTVRGIGYMYTQPPSGIPSQYDKRRYEFREATG